jgi:hypothetical protein
MDCYVLGRSCQCISKLKWVEQFPWKQLTGKHETWRQQILAFKQNDRDPKLKGPPTLLVARSELGRKSLAEICQEQLRLRPWVDYKKPKEIKAATPTDDDGSDSESRARKRRKSNGNKAPSGKGRCHMCKSSECLWKLAACEKCNLYYCYGSLFRAFDMLPLDAMQRPHWLCPKCRKICNCSSCRQDNSMNPHQPFNILLGHDTRKIADPRSVESLVNMRLSNLALLKTFGEDNAERLERLRSDEEKRRQKQLVDNEIHVALDSPHSESVKRTPVMFDTQLPGIPIDPALELDGSFMNFG